MLKIENLTGGYVNIPVLKNISFEVNDGELVGFYRYAIKITIAEHIEFLCKFYNKFYD